MNIWKRAKAVSICAKWMSDEELRLNEKLYWNSDVFTTKNRNPHPEYWPKDAEEIFEEMIQRGMLERIDIHGLDEKRKPGTFSALIIRLSPEWHNAIRGNMWDLYFMPFFRGLYRGSKAAWVIAIASFAGAKFIGKLLENWADHLSK